ncbi:MAG: hypothetical protein KDC44_05550, partial [Phaeodactylibacter sp.]|nr:hypothetical protein [Phaeodactylibacter sp.]
MKDFLLFLLLLLARPLIGQGDFLEYHTGIRSVQQQLVDERFDSALAQLLPLLDTFDAPYVKDWVIASQLAVLTGQQEQAIRLLERAFSKGFSLNCAQKVPLFDHGFSPVAWDTLTRIYPDCHRSYLASIDLEAWQELHARYQREQEAKQSEYY